MAGGILVPHPGIRSVSPALEAQSLNHWTSREFPKCNYFNMHENSTFVSILRLCVFSRVEAEILSEDSVSLKS